MKDSPLARRLRIARAAKGLTLREVEELSGVSMHTIMYAEKSTRKPYRTTLRKLADVYDIPVSELTLAEEAVSPLA